jgi:hypothetical protein
VDLSFDLFLCANFFEDFPQFFVRAAYFKCRDP